MIKKLPDRMIFAAILAALFSVQADSLAQTNDTSAMAPHEGDYIPDPGPRDRAYGISGAQATDVFSSVLEQAWQERHTTQP